ncbi:MAG: hypothetical protein ACRECA_05290 [Pseudolabrys sp.]
MRCNFVTRFLKKLRPLSLLDGICRRARRQDFRAGVTLAFCTGFLRHENDLMAWRAKDPKNPYGTGIFADAAPREKSSRAWARNARRVPRFCATHQHLGKNPFHIGAAAMKDISRNAAQACRRISLRPVNACVS